MIPLLIAAYASPLPYQQTLEKALENDARVQRAALTVESAAIGVRASYGVFDPNAGFSGNWRTSQQKGFFQGFPFESSSRTWNLGANLGGTLPTGTGYQLDASMDRNYSSFVTDFGVGGLNEQIQDAYTSRLAVTLTQQLLRGIKPGFNLQNVTVAKQVLTSAELRAVEASQETLSAAAKAYWSWVYQRELVGIAREGMDQAKEALRVGDLQLGAGEIAPLERTRLSAAEVQSRVTLMDAELAERAALQNLLSLIGEDPGQAVAGHTFEPDAVPDTPPSMVDPEAAIEAALTGNPGLQVARMALDDAEVNLGLKRHARLPSLAANVSAGIQAQDDTLGQAITGLAEDQAFPYLSVGADFSMPIGNRAARGAAKQASVEVDQRRLDVEELERTIRIAVLAQIETVNAGALRLELAQSNVALAEESLAAEEALQEAGRSIQRNLLDARVQLTRSQGDLVKARTDHAAALVELQRLQGRLTTSSSL